MKNTTISLTRRHFIFLAEIIRECPENADIAKHFADRLAWTNPNFNQERFLRACAGK